MRTQAVESAPPSGGAVPKIIGPRAVAAAAVTASRPARPLDAVEPAPRPGIRDVLRLPAFAVLFGAELQSIAGDQLARVALSVLVFARTGSAVATAATYAATLLPAVVGGALISRIGDRLPRRGVMITVDAFRALCFAAMAIPGVPLGAVIGLVVLSVAAGPVFTAAEVSDLSTRLTTEQFRLGTAARVMSNQGAQVIGFAAGGAIVAAVGPRLSLLVNAATFAVSVIAISWLAARPDGGARRADTGAPATARRDAAPFAGLWRTTRIRRLLALCCAVGFFVAPEGLAVPFAAAVRAPTYAIGVLLGAAALGAAVGAGAISTFVPAGRRESVAYGMAVLAGLPLIVTAVTGVWQIVACAWFASGFLVAYMVEVTSALVQAIPERHRAHYVGVAGAYLIGSQGVGLLVFGAVAAASTPAGAIAIAGVLGSLLAAIAATGTAA
jgi:MFS family permease